MSGLSSMRDQSSAGSSSGPGALFLLIAQIDALTSDSVMGSIFTGASSSSIDGRFLTSGGRGGAGAHCFSDKYVAKVSAISDRLHTSPSDVFNLPIFLGW